MKNSKELREIYLAGGCFWGLEKYMWEISGVVETEVGYANGKTENPTYEEVCNLNTGHAETVKVVYDPYIVSLEFLLTMYYDVINPTSLNRQGGDVGSQYRTGIYYTRQEDVPVIGKSLEDLQSKTEGRLAIEAKPLYSYYRAEEYHQKYLDKNPGGYCHIGKDKFEGARSAIVDPARYAAPTHEQLEEKLLPMEYAVTQNSKTEPPYQNEFNDHYDKGIYVDITTGEPLFLSGDKFESGCGWPSFTKPIDPNVLKQYTDTGHGMLRTEVRSRVGDAHLGHVFNDGPLEDGGRRYCINSAALRFVPLADMEEEGYSYLTEHVK